MTALVVDDDRDLLQSIENLAQTAGIPLHTAATWEEGLLAFQAISPSVVIADYNMPGSSHGLRLLFEMARLRPSVRLVLMSAYLDTDDLAAVEAFDFVDAAFRKVDPVTTARSVLQEMSKGEETAHQQTDWVALASAAHSTREVREEDLEKLDEYLRINRLPGDDKSS